MRRNGSRVFFRRIENVDQEHINNVAIFLEAEIVLLQVPDRLTRTVGYDDIDDDRACF